LIHPPSRLERDVPEEQMRGEVSYGGRGDGGPIDEREGTKAAGNQGKGSGKRVEIDGGGDGTFLRAWVEKHGVACGWYTGRKNVSTVEREPTREEQPSGEEPAESLWKDVQEAWETNATSLSAPWGRVEWKGGFFQEDRALQSTATDE